MRKLFSIILGCAIILLSACSTDSLAYYDDIYTTSSDAQYSAPAPKQTKSAPAELQPDSIVYEYDENGNLLDIKTYYPGQTEPTVTYYEIPVEESATVVTDYDDDCYDYYYTSRLRRFHTNLYCGYGYYDPYFTNLYWYDNNPYNWGLSIYMGYNWWWPSYYRPYYYDYGWYHYGFNYGWGWHPPYGGWWDYGYHSWHHPHHYLAADYWHNHLDPNHSYYYGHRNSIGPSVGNHNPDREDRPFTPGLSGNNDNNNHYSITSSAPTFNQRYDNIAAQYSTSGRGGGSSPASPSVPTSRPTTPAPVNNRGNLPAMEKPSDNITRENQAAPKPTTNSRPVTPGESRINTNTTKTPTVINRTVPSQSTTRPVNSSSSTTSPSRTSTTTPASTPQRYNSTPSRSTTTPSSNSSRPATSSSSSSPTRTNYSNSSRSSHPASTPSNSSSSRSSYSTPSRNYYSGSSSPSRSSYSGSSSSSRSSYSGSSSSSSRSSYSSGSSSHSSYSSGSSSHSSSSSSSSRSGGSYSGGRR